MELHIKLSKLGNNANSINVDTILMLISTTVPSVVLIITKNVGIIKNRQNKIKHTAYKINILRFMRPFVDKNRSSRDAFFILFLSP